jgi:hypothetical protein
MVLPQKGKTDIDKLHKRFLCSMFQLQEFYPGLKGIYPDLFSMEDDPSLKPTCLFEMKTRIYPLAQNNSSRAKNQFEWWDIVDRQRKLYQKFRDLNEIEAFWIFVLATTQTQMVNMDTVDESKIVSRDVYVAPWSAYGLAPLTSKGRRNLNLTRLKEEYASREYLMVGEQDMRLGVVHMLGGVEEIIAHYFLEKDHAAPVRV